MSLKLRWTTQADLEAVARTRLLCYAPAMSMMEDYRKKVDCWGRAKPTDHVLAERAGRVVGTATSLHLTMWVRSAPQSCQGVAYVGAIKTERRKGGTTGEPGVASAVMHELLRAGRERGHVVSALMPWRASYYEHFGYGLVERHCDWTVPLAILPHGDFAGYRFMEESDKPAIRALNQKIVESGQCDIETSPACWEHAYEYYQKGFVAVDRPDDTGPVRGWVYFEHKSEQNHDVIHVEECGWDSPASLMRQLHFLASLRDQYSAAVMTFAPDLQLNRLLRESQIPHRIVNHPAATCKLYTRMQVRILDHLKFLSSLQLPDSIRGSAIIEVKESEGHASRFKIDIQAGRISAANSSESPTIICTDRVWASVACGDWLASEAAKAGQLDCANASSLSLLKSFADGPAPYCREGF